MMRGCSAVKSDSCNNFRSSVHTMLVIILRSVNLKMKLKCYVIKENKQLYCIVLYLKIYIALLAVHTNQNRFQCERPREKKAVLRERKDALGTPVNKVDRLEGRSWFQSEGS